MKHLTLLEVGWPLLWRTPIVLENGLKIPQVLVSSVSVKAPGYAAVRKSLLKACLDHRLVESRVA